MNAYRYILEPYKGSNTRYRCPKCNTNKTFRRYIDVATGEHIANNVGWCDRTQKCNYHYTPYQYFKDNNIAIGINNQFQMQRGNVRPKPDLKPVSYIPFEKFQASLTGYDYNNLVIYLVKLFGVRITNSLIRRYLIGSSKHWRGAVSFPQIDLTGSIRQIKVMDYDPKTGKRRKAGQTSWKLSYKDGVYYKDVHGRDKIFFAGKSIIENYEARFVQCFFGEHLLNEMYKPVAIVESEKTAIIASVFLPNYIWLATGGINGCKWTENEVYIVLRGRDVILFPDLNAYGRWEEKSNGLSTVARSLTISNLLEDVATDDERSAGLDLADYLIRFNHKEFNH